MFTMVNAGLGKGIANLVAGLFGLVSSTPVTCHLYSNVVVWSNAVLLAGLTETDFTGYAAAQISTWETAYQVGPGGAVLYAAVLCPYIPTASTLTGSAWGYYLLDGSGDLIGGEPFSSEFLFTGVNTPLYLIPQIALPQSNAVAVVY